MKLMMACIALVFSSIALADKPALSLNDIDQIRRVVTANMSPDGQYMAVTLTRRPILFQDVFNDGVRDLYIVDSNSQIIPYVTRGDAIGAVRWSADSQKIWFLAKRFDEEHVALYMIALGGGEARLVVRHEGDIGGFALHENGERLLYWATPPVDNRQKTLAEQGFTVRVFEETKPRQQLYELDLSASKGKGKRVPFDEHVVSAAYLNDSDLIMIQSAKSALTDDILLRKTLGVYGLDGRARTVFNHQGKMGKALGSPDGEHIAIVGSRDRKDPAEGRLLIASIDNPTLTDILPGLEGHIMDIFWLNDDKIGFILHKGVSSVLGSKKITNTSLNFRSLNRTAGIHSRATASRNGKNIAVVAHHAEHPHEAFWYTRRSMVRVTDSNPWLNDRQFARQNAVEYPARDGVKLEGILVTPEQRKSPLPLLIFVHGGPEAHYSDGWLNRYVTPVHVAANQGYAVFLPNYRGSTGRGVAFTKLGQQDYAGAEFNDLVDAKHYLVKEGWADPDRVGISGASYGGYASAWAATRLTEEFAAAVGSMSVTNQLSKFGLTDIPSDMKEHHALDWPWKNWKWLYERSPVAHAGSSNTPLLLLHGVDDLRVPSSQSRELYRHMKIQGKIVRLVEYEDEGHGFLHATSRYDYSRRLMRWMDRFVKHKDKAQSRSLPPWQLPYQINEQGE